MPCFAPSIRTKTLTVLRKLDIERKKRVLLFLIESSLLSEKTQYLLSGADYNRIKIDLADCLFVNAHFVGVHFQQVSFTNCIFHNVTFREANLNRAILTHGVFSLTHCISCQMDHVNFQGAIISETYFNSSTLSYADFQQVKWFNNTFLNINLTGAIFSTILPDHLFIRNSLLPNGTFTDIDEIHMNVNQCESLDEWIVQPKESLQVNNCTFVATIFNATMQQFITMPFVERSMLINAAQAKFLFKFHQNGTRRRISVNIIFASLQSTVYEPRDMGKFLICSHAS